MYIIYGVEYSTSLLFHDAPTYNTFYLQYLTSFIISMIYLPLISIIYSAALIHDNPSI